MDDRRIVIRLRAGAWLSFNQCGSHNLLPNRQLGHSPGSKEARAWSWPHIPI